MIRELTTCQKQGVTHVHIHIHNSDHAMRGLSRRKQKSVSCATLDVVALKKMTATAAYVDQYAV